MVMMKDHGHGNGIAKADDEVNSSSKDFHRRQGSWHWLSMLAHD